MQHPKLSTLPKPYSLIAYGFIKSDIVTLLIPTILLGTVASGGLDPVQLIMRVLWVSLHLLQFCVSNQSIDPDEDKKNKPWRPIPSGQISLSAARRLRWALFAACILFSAICNVLPVGITLLAATYAHNEMLLGDHWFMRHALTTIGYVAFGSGAIQAGCRDPQCKRSSRELFVAQIIISLAVLTTIHAQDFKDVEGDRLIHRRTLPILCPTASRISVAFFLVLWSILTVCVYDQSGMVCKIGTVMLGVITAGRFLVLRSNAADKTSYYLLYNVWLCFVHAIPFM